jgi:hypothetical protein
VDLPSQAAFQVVVNGHGNIVAGSLHQAFHHIGRLLCPETADFDRFGRASEFPHLQAAKVDDSFYHRIRFELEVVQADRSFEQIAIVVHDVNAPAGHDTVFDSYDLAGETDPSYEVITALYKLETTDETVADVADDLEAAVEARLAAGPRFGESEEKFVGRMRRWQSLLKGPKIIPDEGSAAEILQRLPSIARERFVEFAAKAFPDEIKPGVA